MWYATLEAGLMITFVLPIRAIDDGPATLMLKQLSDSEYRRQLAQAVDGLKQHHHSKIEGLGKAKQYLIAAKLTFEKSSLIWQNNPSIFYTNMNLSDLKKSDDFDNSQLNAITHCPTSHCSMNSSTTVHTEVQFMYGKKGMELLDSMKAQDVMLVVTYYVPCSQGGGSYSECSGEMASYRAKHRNIKFVIVYEEVWDRTSLCVTNLYLEYAGIPTLNYRNGTGAELMNPGFRKFMDEPKFYKAPNHSTVGTPARRYKMEVLAVCLKTVGLLVDSVRIDLRAGLEENEDLMYALTALYVLGKARNTDYMRSNDFQSDFQRNRNADGRKKLNFCDGYLKCNPKVKKINPTTFNSYWRNINKCAIEKSQLAGSSITYEEVYRYLGECLRFDTSQISTPNPQSGSLTASCAHPDKDITAGCQSKRESNEKNYKQLQDNF